MAKRSADYLDAFVARLREAMAAAGFSQAALARKLARNAAEARSLSSAISRWWKGDGVPDPEMMAPLAVALGISLEFLLTGKERTPAVAVADKDARRVPLVGAAAAGEPLHVIRETRDVEWSHFPRSVLRHFYGTIPDDERAVMLTVEGDSMTPDLQDGAIVFVDRGHGGEGLAIERIRKEDIYMVRPPGSDGVTLKRVTVAGHWIHLRPSNPSHDVSSFQIPKGFPIQRVVRGRVVGKIERF